MPLTGWDIHKSSARPHVYSFYQHAILIIEILLKMAADTNNRLGRCMMTMNRHHCSRFNCIEHPLRLIFRKFRRSKFIRNRGDALDWEVND